MTSPHRVCLEKGSQNWRQDFSFLHLRRYLKELREGRLNRDTDKMQKMAIAASAHERHIDYIVRHPTHRELPTLPSGTLERWQVAASEIVTPEATATDGTTEEVPALDLAAMQRESMTLIRTAPAETVRESTPRQTGSIAAVTPEIILHEEPTEPKAFTYHDPADTIVGLYEHALAGFLEAHRGHRIAYMRMSKFEALSLLMFVNVDPELLEIDVSLDDHTIVIVSD